MATKGQTMRRLVFADDSMGRGAYYRIYDALLLGWKERTSSGLREFNRLLDAVQSASDLREVTEAQRAEYDTAAKAQGQRGWEQSEHDRVLRDGEQAILLAENDYSRLRGAFESVTTWDPRSSRSVEAAQKVLDSAEVVEVVPKAVE